MNKYTKILSLAGLFCLLFILMAQDFNSSDDPNIDRPNLTSLAYSNKINNYQPNAVVITDANGYDNFNLGTDFAEVYMTTNPTNQFSIFNAYNTNGGHWTSDGLNWTNQNPVVPNTAGDPWSGADSSGNLYYITLNSSVSGTWVNKSTTFGSSWGTAVSGCIGNDRETIAVDATGGPFSGYIYCGETPGNFSRSTNGGVSFTQTATLTESLPGFMMTPAPGPTGISGGAVYVCTSTGAFQAPTYTLYRSTDGGATFTTQSTQNGWVNVVGTIVGGRNSYQNMRLRPYPFIYADNSFGPNRGRVYIFYCANNPGGDGNKPSVYLKYSDDGCVNFSSPIMINDDSSPTSNAHFHEQGWCDKSTGRLYCQWMDTRTTPTADSAEIWGSMSTNGGITWAANQKISTAKMRINCPTCGGGGVPAYQGDYSAASSNGRTGHFAWTDFRAGTFGSYFAYLPDFGMKVNPTIANLNGNGDSSFAFVTIPSVKLYTDKVKFTATVTPTPANGTITLSFLNKSNASQQDSITTYPDSVRIRIKTTGGVTQQSYTVTVIAKGRTGNVDQTPVHSRTINLSVITGINGYSNEVPDNFYLYQNYPNPFNPNTNIKFDLARSGNVKLTVYDITGKSVAELLNSNYTAGTYSYDFDASNYATGVYFYKLETPQYTSIRKMILVK